MSDADHAAAREHFGEQGLVAPAWRVIAINGWNRLNIAFRVTSGSKDRLYGLDKSGLS